MLFKKQKTNELYKNSLVFVLLLTNKLLKHTTSLISTSKENSDSLTFDTLSITKVTSLKDL